MTTKKDRERAIGLAALMLEHVADAMGTDPKSLGEPWKQWTEAVASFVFVRNRYELWAAMGGLQYTCARLDTNFTEKESML